MVEKVTGSRLRVLITGGAGYLGGRLAVYLKQNGHTVTIGTRGSKPTSKTFKPFNFVQTLWSDKNSLENACKNIDVVIHAAGMNSYDCEHAIDAGYEANGLSTKRLINSAYKVGVSRFIYLSTVHVYKNPLQGFLNEDFTPDNLHPYAQSKLAGENFVRSVNKNFEIDAFVLRLSNAIGPPAEYDIDCWNLLVNDLCKQVVKSRKIILNSSGEQERDFISINQVCSVIQNFLVMKKNELKYDLFNLSSGVSLTILDMARLVQSCCISTLNFNPILEHLSVENDIKYPALVLDNSRLSEINVSVQNQLRKEIEELLIFCEENY